MCLFCWAVGVSDASISDGPEKFDVPHTTTLRIGEAMPFATGETFFENRRRHLGGMGLDWEAIE